MKDDSMRVNQQRVEEFSAWLVLGLSGQLTVLFDARQIDLHNACFYLTRVK